MLVYRNRHMNRLCIKEKNQTFFVVSIVGATIFVQTLTYRGYFHLLDSLRVLADREVPLDLGLVDAVH